MERTGPSIPSSISNRPLPGTSKGLDANLDLDGRPSVGGPGPLPPPPVPEFGQVIAGIVASLERVGLVPEDLDDLVLEVAHALAAEDPATDNLSHEDASGVPRGTLLRHEGIASDVNNGGLRAQVEYLHQHACSQSVVKLQVLLKEKLGVFVSVKTPEHGHLLGGLRSPDASCTFTARLLMPGDKYGRNRCLTWGAEIGKGATPDVRQMLQEKFGSMPGVEFYDADCVGKPGFDPLGQFVSRYYLSNLLGGPEGRGLALDGGIPQWAISAEDLRRVKDWAREICPEVEPETRW